ncbi:MAG: O-antigen ligase family protein [Phycisphaerales bacterium]|nr:O-antigen ligase family protein [Phycisphaerales bacterium]
MSCIAALLYLFGVCLIYLYNNHLPITYLFNPIFFNHNFTKPIDIHAGYYSIYLSLAISFMLSVFVDSKKYQKFLIILAIVVMSVGLFFLASRNTIISTVVVLLFFFPLFNAKNKMRFFSISVVLVVLFVLVGGKSNYIRTRFSNELIEDIRPNNHYSLENPEPRIMRWQCAWDLIKKRPFWGYGTGEEIKLLKAEYLKRNMMISYKEEFNTHNQYLAVLLKNGFFGLILFLSMLLYFFRLAIQSKNFTYFSFLIVLSVGFLTENFIDANKGIFYFAFFNTLLGYHAYYIANDTKAIETDG